MPELPEVETVVRTLRPRLLNRAITGVQLQRADILDPPGTNLPALLSGRIVAQVERRGKRIVITLDDGNRFYVHLGMTGRLTIESPDAPMLNHTHLIVEFAGSATAKTATATAAQVLHMRFSDPRRFGGVWWLGRDISPDDGMGPEPLALRSAHLARQLATTSRAIKTALLDQTLIAGLGNIYVDESLFAAAIHPFVPANGLSTAQVTALNRAIKRILNKAISHRGSTLRDYRDANGDSGGFQLRHKVYDRADKPCRVCKSSIARIVLGGRSTHFCPTCQKRR